MKETTRSWLSTGGTLLGAVLVAALALLWLTQPDSGPAPLAWDREACGYCRMHIGDRQFAAQLRLGEGEPVNFDDPGCLFLYLDERGPTVRALFFRHERDDRWLDDAQVAFRVGVEPTPMGFGLAATTREQAPEALGLDEARAWLRARRQERER